MPTEKSNASSQGQLSVPLLIQHYQFEKPKEVLVVGYAAALPENSTDSIIDGDTRNQLHAETPPAKKPGTLSFWKKRNDISRLSRHKAKIHPRPTNEAIVLRAASGLRLPRPNLYTAPAREIGIVKTSRQDGYPRCLSAYGENKTSGLWTVWPFLSRSCQWRFWDTADAST